MNTKTKTKTMTQTQTKTTQQTLHERIMEEAEAMNFPTHIIDLPPMMTPKYDEDGHIYVTDTNNVIRYYLDTNQNCEGRLCPTEDFYNNIQIVDSKERTNTLEKIYNAY
jgi:hypothetical protein